MSEPQLPDLATFHAELGRFIEKRPFFVVGVQRSGTTWLANLINAHPEALCTGEARFFNNLPRVLGDLVGAYNADQQKRSMLAYRMPDRFPVIDMNAHAYLYMILLRLLLRSRADGKDLERVKVVGDKTPENVRSMVRLSKLCVGARFIHLIRDGRDVMVSAWFNYVRLEPDVETRQFRDLDAFIDATVPFWCERVAMGRAYGRRFPDEYLELRYESLVADPAPELARIFSFLGIDSEPETVAACIETARFERLSGGRERGADDPGSHFRKGVVGDWRNHLEPRHVALFERYKTPLIADLGPFETTSS